jgi:hypothetical protein
MANVKISELTAASAVAAANQFEINEAGTSKRVTALQIADYVRTVAGTVRQVVMGTTATDAYIASTTFTDTNLTASITPSSTSNKILALVSQSYIVGRDTVGCAGAIQLLRGSTQLFTVATYEIGNELIGSGTTYAQLQGRWSAAYLDSPNTTSAVTYKTQARVNDTANSAFIDLQHYGDSTSTIILMEIVA